MTDYEPGTRVLAIRNTDPNINTVYSYGEGTYVGDRLRPGMPEIASGDEASVIRKAIEEMDAVDLDEHPAIQFIRLTGPMVGWSEQQIEDQIQGSKAKILADQQRPLEERIQELYVEANSNPCIQLDNGWEVWGFQSWWGPVDAVKTKFSGWTMTEVMVPEGNVRWEVPTNTNT